MASVSCGITSMRRSCPLTFSVIIRSTAPAAVGWPWTVVVRNKYAVDEAAAPAATTPLMKFRRENSVCVSSDICLSSIAGSPRRTDGPDRKERGFARQTIIRIPFGFNDFATSDPESVSEVSTAFRGHQMSSIVFLGAAGTVTGSRHLLEAGGLRVLVDCGLFQGLKELRLRNWAPLQIAPASIDAVVLTHAHLDHCGYLPRLVAAGFRGRIYCTPATRELCALVLPDSAHLQEEDAKHANDHQYSKHRPALPLYTQIDAARALTQLQPLGYDRPVPIVDGAGDAAPTVEFINAGHLLGSAYARIRMGGSTLLFGGDLGRYGRPVLPDPAPVAEADYLLVESTYGDRAHEP